ncbi:MAG: SpoIIIAH-like family protein [Lachnospiraceae bacterium]|nr:SpoIIIAH-like family protein [Lachnospiraceae bacterium]
MRLFRKNQLVITALAALIAVAGYLNHVEKTEKEGTLAGAKVTEETTAEETTVQEDTAAASSDIASNEIDIEGEPGEAVLVNAAGTVDFIVEAKLAREEVRANSKEALMEIINNQELSDEEKTSAVERMVELTENAEKESAAEALIEAKGYENVAVTISEEGVDVMVVADSLDNAARAQIEEIVKTKAGVSADQITITAVKNIEK